MAELQDRSDYRTGAPNLRDDLPSIARTEPRSYTDRHWAVLTHISLLDTLVLLFHAGNASILMVQFHKDWTKP